MQAKENIVDLAAQRRFFAEEIQMVSNVRSRAIVEGLATVPRERFLPPGPWTVRGEGDLLAPLRQTADGDPRHVYHNVAIGIDPARMLFNGAPGLLAMTIDALGLDAGDRALHIGAGTGYYTALMGHCVGSTGRIVAIEVDEKLAADAKANLAPMPWVEVRHGNGTAALGESFNAILINAGVTHPQETWLDALAPGGRMILPLTTTFPAMGPLTTTMPAMGAIGKGLLVLLTRSDDPSTLAARVVTFVAIYSGIGLRDESVNTEIGKALAKHPFPPIKALRRDPHAASASCWLHGTTFCFSLS